MRRCLYGPIAKQQKCRGEDHQIINCQMRSDEHGGEQRDRVVQIKRRAVPPALDGGHEHRDCADHIESESKDRKSTRLNSSHVAISYAVFCLKKKKKKK